MAIIVPIDADTSGLTRKLHGATSSLGGFAKMAGLAAGAAALGGLVATVKIGVDEFMQAEKVTAQTNAVLKSTGGIANVTKKQIEDLGTQIMRKSGMDDEAVKSAENLLLTFTNVRNEAGKGNDVFSQATKITADLSVAFGKDLNSSAILVGKALNDPVKGLGALSRVGIQFSEDQKKVIKKLVESGDTMQAQKMILKELETQVGGSAAAYGNTLSGKLAIARETFRNLAADIVSVVMPAVANAASILGRFVSELASKKDFKAKIDFVLETAEQLAQRFWTWWTQPSLKTVRSPTSGVHVEFTPPGSEQVDRFLQSLDTALRGRLDRWAHNAGYNLLDSLFNGAKSSANDKAGSGLGLIIKLINPAEFAKWSLDRGVEMLQNFWDGMQKWIKEHPGVASKAIKDWITSAGDSLKGAAGEVWNRVASEFTGKVRTGVVDRNTVAKVLTNDMKAAIQSARNGLAGAASGLVGMLNQIIAGRGIDSAKILADQRDLEDRRLQIQEDQLKAARDATEENTSERVQAQLELDQFYFDKNATIRQRQVEDDQKKNQTQIDNLVTRFNKGLISAQEFSDKLDAIIGADRGQSLGDAFAMAFTNALQSVKNAASDIFNIVGASGQASSPLGPDIGTPGSFNQGPATAAANAQYQTDLGLWNELVSLRRQRDAADKGSKERKRLQAQINAFKDAHPNITKRPARSDYGLVGLAMGGILTSPHYLAGEAGNEAVIPLGSPTAVQMMRKAFSEAVSGGGDTVYNISINAGMGADGTDIGRQIVEAIKVFERRNGPVFAGA